jgi:M6 family metalloprotease-like protein
MLRHSAFPTIVLSLLALWPIGQPLRLNVTAADQNATNIRTVQLVIILVDYADGRLPDGSLPTGDADTLTVQNIDAVGSMGWVPVNSALRKLGYRKHIRKYVYEDYWDPMFSKNEYRGARHPDYSSHQGYIPPIADDDTQEQYNLEVFGSVRDYWSEVSYTNLVLEPYRTHVGTVDKYHTGIANNIIDANGNRYIRWIKLPYPKSVYKIRPSDPGRDPVSDALSVIDSLHYHTALTDPEHIEFDLRSYNGTDRKIAIITAGGRVGGWADLGGQWFIVPEKMQYFRNTTPSVIFNPIGEFAHEFGHTLGISHQVVGPYDLMHWGGLGLRRNYFCPPHINPELKFELGWITERDIIKVSSSQFVNLPPIDQNNKKIALIEMDSTVGNRFGNTNGEYLLVEYRKREGFNKCVGGPDTSFQGGALIWHFSNRGGIQFGPADDVRRNLVLEVANYGPKFKRNPGSPSHFFYERHTTLDETTDPNSNSFENRPTGISLNQFAVKDDRLTFYVDYKGTENPKELSRKSKQ